MKIEINEEAIEKATKFYSGGEWCGGLMEHEIKEVVTDIVVEYLRNSPQPAEQPVLNLPSSSNIYAPSSGRDAGWNAAIDTIKASNPHLKAVQK